MGARPRRTGAQRTRRRTGRAGRVERGCRGVSALARIDGPRSAQWHVVLRTGNIAPAGTATLKLLRNDRPRIGANERAFISDMAKRLQKNNFAPTEKQTNWVKGLMKKYRDA